MPGLPFVIRHGKFSDVAFAVVDSIGVTLEDIGIESAVGQAFGCVHCGDVRLSGVRLAPPPGEPMSTNAGGIILNDIRAGTGLSV